MDNQQLKFVIEAALLAAGKPLGVDKLLGLFGEIDSPARQDLRAAIMDLQADYAERGIELVEVSSGFRIQIRSTMTHQLEKLWEERPPRYSRALLETLSIIVYRQPVTRGEIEEIRGVAVSTNITRTLLERSWIRVVGHRDVPGKPAMFGTTKEFLDYFGLKKLDELPPLSELKDFDKLDIQLDLPDGVTGEEKKEISPVEEGSAADRDFASFAEAVVDFDEKDIDDHTDNDTDNVVTSLDAAREAAAGQVSPNSAAAEHAVLTDADVDGESATVLPLKKT